MKEQGLLRMEKINTDYKRRTRTINGCVNRDAASFIKAANLRKKQLNIFHLGKQKVETGS